MKNIIIRILFIILFGFSAGLPLMAITSNSNKEDVQKSVVAEKVTRQVQIASISKEIQDLKSKIYINEEKFDLLMSSEKPDLNLLYQNVDELQDLEKQLSKSRKQFIRTLLFIR